MKSIRLMVLSAASLLVVACGDAGLRSVPTSPKSPAPTASTPQPADLLSAEVRVQGDDANGQDVLLRVADVRITAEGRLLAVQRPHAQVLDLGNTDQGWLVGTFQVPRSVASVHVRLTFDDFGGYQGPAGAGALDARTRPIEFDAPISSLALRGHAVVHVDLQRSIVPAGPARGLLLPVLKVEY